MQGYDSLRAVTKLSKLEVPAEILHQVEGIKTNDEQIRNFGIDLAVKMCKQLLLSGTTSAFHFYTLNLEVSTIEIIRRLGMLKQEVHRTLPWKMTANYKRSSEDVRPIFWQNRPNSYIQRTMEWDEYPNGRWGNSASPAFGDLKDYHLFYLRSRVPKDDLKNMWLEHLESPQDVFDIFYCYLSGTPNKEGARVTTLPWSDGELAPETLPLLDQLASINKKGILTINSQPNVNGASSTDKVHGWGNPGGYVYQKVILRFFYFHPKMKLGLHIENNVNNEIIFV